jgi:hypothetical protein
MNLERDNIILNHHAKSAYLKNAQLLDTKKNFASNGVGKIK